MEEDDKNPQQVGVGVVGVWLLFIIHGTVGVDLRIGYLGGHPLYGKVPGGVPVQGGETADGADTMAETSREVDVHLSDNVRVGGGVPDDGGIHLAMQEHGHTVHFYAITVRPV